VTYIAPDALLAKINGEDEFKVLLREAKTRHDDFKRKFGKRGE